MYYTILINTESWGYERDGEEVGEKEIRFNSKLFWKLADSILYSFYATQRRMKNAYVGLSPSYENIYTIKSPYLDDNSHTDTFYEEETGIKAFSKLAGDSLKQWPDEVDHISITIEFCDDNGLPTDADMLRISELANIDCEAVILDEDTNQLVCQGYERGEYETGYYSNDQAEVYLADHDCQKTLKDMQSESILKKIMVT